MLMHVFRCPGCHRPPGIGAELVKPRVRCPASRAAFVRPSKTRLRLSKGRRPEMIGLVMARSKN
jgi:hypothetical protein